MFSRDKTSMKIKSEIVFLYQDLPRICPKREIKVRRLCVTSVHSGFEGAYLKEKKNNKLMKDSKCRINRQVGNQHNLSKVKIVKGDH